LDQLGNVVSGDGGFFDGVLHGLKVLVQKLCFLVILDLLGQGFIPKVLLDDLFLAHVGVPNDVVDESGLNPLVVCLLDGQGVWDWSQEIGLESFCGEILIKDLLGRDLLDRRSRGLVLLAEVGDDFKNLLVLKS